MEESEVICLLLGAVGLLLLRRLYQTGTGWQRNFVLGFFLILGAYLLTVLESLFWPEVLNLAEHLLYALGGLALLRGVVDLGREGDAWP